jgi:hypothetical protein
VTSSITPTSDTATMLRTFEGPDEGVGQIGAIGPHDLGKSAHEHDRGDKSHEPWPGACGAIEGHGAERRARA